MAIDTPLAIHRARGVHRRRGRVWAAATLLVVLAPSTNLGFFDGIPLSSGLEYAALLALAPCLLSRMAATQLGRVVARVRGLALGAVLTGVVVLKLTAAAVGPHVGFRAEYRSPLADPVGAREVSYENPLGRNGATRLDRAIDFEGGSWNLVFLNSLRFNYYGPDAPHDRRRLPIQARWETTVRADAPWQLRVEYVGDLRLRVDGREHALPAHYGSVRQDEIGVAAGRQELSVAFAFDDLAPGARDGPYARVRLCRVTPNRETCGALPVARAPAAWRALAVVLDAAVLLLTLPLALVYVRIGLASLWFALISAAAAAGAVALIWFGGPAHEAGAFLGLMLVLAAALWRRGRHRHLVVSYGVLALWVMLLALRWFGSPDAVWLRPGGEDWLTYEDHARAVLETRSLEGGEPVFYYQPFFRYVVFGAHLMLGDGDTFIVAAAMLALSCAALGVIAGAVPRRPTSWQWVAWAVPAALLVSWLVAPRVLGLVRMGASEVPTWIALLVAWPLLLRPGPRARWVLGALMIGGAFITRTNQLAGLVAVWTGAALLRRDLNGRWRAAGLLAVLALALLPLAHNIYFGGRFVPLTTSAGIPQNVVLTPDVLADSVQDAEARERVLSQFSFLLGMEADSRMRWTATGLQAVWLVSAVALLVSGRRPVGVYVLALAPPLFLGVHLFYQVAVYYPRHIVIGHIAMALVALTRQTSERA